METIHRRSQILMNQLLSKPVWSFFEHGRWFLVVAMGIVQTSLAQTVIDIHDFEPTNATPEMTRSTQITTGVPYYSNVITGMTPSNVSQPPNSPYFASGAYGFLHWGPNVPGTSDTVVTHIFGAVDTRKYTDVSVSIRVASLNGSQGVDLSDYCEIAVSPDNGTTWYQQLRLTGNGNAYWAFSGTGSVSRTYAPNGDFTTNSAPTGGLLTGDNAITTMTVTGLPSVQQLRVRVRTALNASAEGWCIDDVKVAGTPLTAPTVVTSTPATGVTVSEALEGGSITATGGVNATWRVIEYSTTDGFANGTGTKLIESGDFGVGIFTVSLGGLSGSTVYYYKAFATNSEGTAYGTQQSFTTEKDLSDADGDGLSAYDELFTYGTDPTKADMGRITHP